MLTASSPTRCDYGYLSEQLAVTLQVALQAVKEILDRFAGLSIFCQQPRSRAELQDFCDLKGREHFRKTLLVPLLEV